MAALKPIQPSVCTDKRTWEEICKTALAVPTKEKLEELKKEAEKFKNLVKK